MHNQKLFRQKINRTIWINPKIDDFFQKSASLHLMSFSQYVTHLVSKDPDIPAEWREQIEAIVKDDLYQKYRPRHSQLD